MHRIGQGRLRRLGTTAGLVAIAALAVVSATAASVDVGDGGSAGVFRVSGAAKGKVFVCKYVGKPGVDERLQTGDNPIDVSVNAIPDYQGVGSWFADAQGRSYVLGPEHEANEHVDEPSVSSCPQPEVPPTDVCPNIEGNQAEIPNGMVEDEKGNCVTPPPPPTDVCPNIEGNQAEIPAGMVKDEGGNCVKPTTPPPPPPPSVTSDEFMDVQVVKDATAQVQLVEGQAQIAYTIRVRNEGPNGAHEVELVDAAPSGVTFVAVTLPLSAGSCTVTPALLHCSLGSLGPGVERTIQLSARVAQTGTYVNWATATGNGKDTNGANNTDDASTLVTAPATPPAAPAPTPKPAAKPKPKPHVNICRVLKVTPGMVKANGNRQLVVAKVTQSRNPVRGVAVRFSGKGLRTVVRTNAQGVARVSIAPRKAGIMLVKITSAKACNTARIGVIGAFEPPVTG
jgi:uncharacterized repeat protein (TIGR01451 family)